ncbi:calcineurin-like phosphoesterase [Colletotrichum orchidophilum]|uniref:Calcineurin-like phosphoesterase n=1 Tax=Colletotrichum orchidophilum TaxID=1209926 RepID=A0A1G4BJN7_9PEZI|nr:calcineurin-like phosphoesterase [Colletotrichum orchidophilum]OHF01513.1 calcineurin-like phosphoesterase [Colletotrichum orchidophilum]
MINPSEDNLKQSSGRAHHDFQKTVQILDPKLVPSAESGAPRRRLIIVGDVHGRVSQLQKLLEKVGFDKDAGDHLVFTGDLVNKGPDSSGVVQLAMDLGASCVRGNNEDRVLAARGFIERGVVIGPTGDDGKLFFEDSKEKLPADIPYAVSSDYVTATQLSGEQVSWLSSLPLILQLGPFKGAKSCPWNAGSVVVAHGGLVPLVPLEEQDPWAVMNMRSLVYPTDGAHPENIEVALAKRIKTRLCRRAAFQATKDERLDGELARVLSLWDSEETSKISTVQEGRTIPIELKDGKRWRDAWNETQNITEEPENRSVVVYGHDAKEGLQVQPDVEVPETFKEKGIRGLWTRYAFGLDSGCAYGKELSAMVIETNPDRSDIVHRIEQVDKAEA